MICAECKKDKEPDAFYSSNQSRCRVCVLTAQKATAKRNRVMGPDERIVRVKSGLPVRNSTIPSSERYEAKEIEPFTGRPNCNQALDCPSRTGDRLVYRDGRVEKC